MAIAGSSSTIRIPLPRYAWAASVFGIAALSSVSWIARILPYMPTFPHRLFRPPFEDDVLIAILEDTTVGAQTRCTAAKTILERALQAHEIENIIERIERLENAVTDGAHKH